MRYGRNMFPRLQAPKKVCAVVLALCGWSCAAGESSGADGIPPDAGAPLGPLVLELGTGLTQHRAVADGDAVELISGPQGGWHLEFTVRGCGQPPAGLMLRYTAVMAATDGGGPGGDMVSVPSTAMLTSRNTVAMDGDCFMRVGDRAVLAVTSPADVVGRTLLLAVEGLRGGETQHRATAAVQVVDQVNELP